MTIAEKIFARHWVLDAAKEKVGMPAVKPGDQGFVRPTSASATST